MKVFRTWAEKLEEKLFAESRHTIDRPATCSPPPATLLSSLLDTIFGELRKRPSEKARLHFPSLLELPGVFVKTTVSDLRAQVLDLLKRAERGTPPRSVLRLRTEIRPSQVLLHLENDEGNLAALSLARTDAPAWFVPRLSLGRQTRIVSLDDDISVHLLWEERFRQSEGGRGLIAHFTRGRDLEKWLREECAHLPLWNLLFLIDYDLGSQPPNGLEWICELGLQRQAILVTSNWNEPHLQQQCLRHGVRLLPKSRATTVPIAWEAQQKCQTILIEDDPLIRSLWRYAAASEEKSLEVFENPAEFFARSESLSAFSHVYVDGEFSSGERGEEVSRRIAELGFKHVFLTTGHPRWRFGPLPWVEGIIGKSPPWSGSGLQPDLVDSSVARHKRQE